MNPIQQLYCTHCTHGSSALEQRQGELAARMLGYTVRAGSLEGEPLRQLYRQIERYVSYHLPRDTPSEEKLQLTAASAPRRLIFIPAAGAWQVIGQVCYRQRDTEGRPGSYFAHLLCREAGPDDQRWTLLDALRLWNAPGWTIEDSENHPFVLPEVPNLDSMLGDASPRIDDRALMEFLQGDDRSVGARLPDRWRDLVPARRIEILKEMLGSLLTIGTTRRQTLLVAVEPETAAMLFYGVGRLLPPGVLREGVSLSTFETSIDRLTTVLAATTFANPQTAEFRTDALRGRGLTLNTFAPSLAISENGSLYADRMIQRLLDGGPKALDHRLATLAAARPERIERLEDFAQTDQAVDMLFRSPGGGNESWRSESSLTDYARRLTRQRLEALEGAESTLGSLCGSVSHWTIVELAATKPPGSAADRALRFLLAKLPDDRIAPLAANGDVNDAWKTELLQSRIATSGRTPPGCQWLWSDEASQSPLAPERQKSIALSVMAGLPSKAVVGMLSCLEADLRLATIDRLLEACGRTPEQWAVFADVVRRLDAASLLAVWHRLQSRLFEVPDTVGAVLSARLREILDSLHEHPSEFQTRLKFLEAGSRWLTEPEPANRLAAWTRCRDAMSELAGMNELASGLRQLTALRRLESAAQRMTEAILEAMPATLVEDDRQGRAKQDCLRAIGRQMLEGKEFLPPAQWQNEALWKKVGWRMEMGSWPTMALRKLSRTPEAQKRMWIAVSVAAAVVLGALAVIGMATVGTGPNRPSSELVIEPGAQRTQRQAASVDNAPTHTETSLQPDGLPDSDLAAQTALEETAEPIANAAQTTPESQPDAGPRVVGESFEEPLVMLAGDFNAAMSPVGALEPPVVAVVRLRVRDANDRPLPEQILRKYTLGAVVREQSGAGDSRLLDLPDLDHGNEAQLFDGVDRVLVQFRCSRKATAASPGGIEALSRSWAEVMITPAQRYEVRFLLSPEAVTTLEQMAAAHPPEPVDP